MQISHEGEQPEAIVEWLQQEMGFRASPSSEAIRKICRGNMIPVWDFLLARVKSEQTVEKIRRNIHVHGSPIGKGLVGKEEAWKEEPQVKMERPNTGKSFRRRGEVKGKGRPATADSARLREGADRERERERTSDGEESVEKSLLERGAAEHEVVRLRNLVQRLGKDLKSRMQDVSREEYDRQRVLVDKSNVRHKQVLLESYDQRSSQSAHIFAEYGRRLSGYVEHAKEAQRGRSGVSDPGLERSQSTVDAHYQSSTNVADESQLVLEDVQERSIRQACELLASNLLEKVRSTFAAYDGSGSQADAPVEVPKLGFEMDGDGIPEEVRETAMSLLKSPPLLLRAMATYTGRIVAIIRSETNKMDIRADAERLRYRYENNRVLEDISADADDSFMGRRRTARSSTKGTNNKNTFKQLRDRQRAHAHQFMATEDAFNQAAEAKRRSDELIWRVHNGSGGGDAASGIQNTGPLRQLELEVWAKDRELAGTRASVSTLVLEVQRLNKMCEERRKAEEALRQKWKRIEEFDSRRMELEGIYTALLRAKVAAAASWEHHSRASREHSASTVIPVCESVQYKANAARDLIEREVEAFQRSPDNRLYMMPAFSQSLLAAMGAGTTAGAEAIAAAEKNADVLAARAAIGDPSAFPSIYRIPAAMLYTSGGEGGDAGLAQVMDSMRSFLRPGGTPDNLLEDLAKAVKQVQILRGLLKSGHALIVAANSSRPEYERSVALCTEKSAEQEKVAAEEWLPQLKAGVQEAQRCLEDCKRVRGLVDEWWEQPAATVVEWVTVDGQNAGTWLALVKQLQTTFYEKQLL